MSSPKEGLEKLKEELGLKLIDSDRLKRPEGIPTGSAQLNQFLLWNGFPKGALTALTGKIGLGATSLWLEAAAHVTKGGRWAAWISNGTAQLFPLTLWQKELNLSRLVIIEVPQDKPGKLLWVLQELMASTLFDLIGCDLGETRLKDGQLKKLDKQARNFQVATVFFAGQERLWNPQLFSLVVRMDAGEMCVERALHKPTPHSISRRISYESFTLHSRTRIGTSFGRLAATSDASFKGLAPRALLGPAKKRKSAGNKR